ncbi:MAG: GNAT family N-acetyltransferase [Elusimicrobia bacterium]|nr:GNAT family N-acetyltransferase [Elusimicrobiota bacterium]
MSGITNKKIEKIVKIEGKSDVVIRTAKVSDIRRIQVLYTEVYGASYSISIVTDREKAKHAIESDDYYWLVVECEGKIIGSLVYALDLPHRISKAFGAVVSQEFRKHDLAYMMMKLVLDDITIERKLVDMVYATTRTTSHAPQRLTESLGFVKLGIFPNTHKVHENETHCLTAYFTKEALEMRKKEPVLIPELLPFYNIVKKQMNIEKEAVAESGKIPAVAGTAQSINFETITAPHFIKNRYKKIKNTGFFQHTYMPFHEPNLVFITPDQSTEVYLHYNSKDKYSVVVGGITSEKNAGVVLESIAAKLNEMNMAYIEVILEAYFPELQRQALSAKFIPSGYFPAIKKAGDKRLDCVVFSRTFEILDFGNVKLISAYRDFLREYVKLWRELYIDFAYAEQGGIDRNRCREHCERPEQNLNEHKKH